MASFLLACLLAFAQFSSSSQSTLSPPQPHHLSPRAIGDLCLAEDQRTAIVGNRLWFMGGKYLFESSVPSNNPQPSSRLYYLDLNTTFPVEQSIPSSILQSIEIPDNVTPRISAQAFGNGGEFWYDNTTLYLYAGISTPNSADGGNFTADHVLAAYNTTEQSWEAISVSGGDLQFGNRYDGCYTSDPYSGLSFHLGGEYNYETPGLLKFNASDPSHPTWVNQTNGPGQIGDPIPNVLEGAMSFIPVGDEGVLVQFGGFNTSGVKKGFWPSFPLDQIFIYDISSSVWSTIEATGAIPPNISQFCTAISPSPDQSSFQINLYGGWDLSTSQDYEDVYVLTVPSFRWIKINDVQNNKEAQLAPIIGRSKHKCHMWNDNQMFVVGGVVQQGAEQVNNETESCGTYPPIRILDVSTFTFKTQFDPQSTYTVPKEVYSVIGGNEKGGATLKTPAGGWNDSNLETIFSKLLPRPTGSSSTSTPAPASPKPGSSSKSNAGAIAGGVVGGLAAIAVIAGVLFWFLRRRKSRVTEEPKITGPDELPSTDQKYMRSELPSEQTGLWTNKTQYSPLPSKDSVGPEEQAKPVSELPAEPVATPELPSQDTLK